MFYENCDDDERPLVWCELCGHPHAEKHRLIPGKWGGSYDEDNVVLLCPNHHKAIHFLMLWYLDGVRRLKVRSRAAQDDGRLMAHFADGPLRKLWGRVVKPIVIDSLRQEGLWHPYKRTLETDAPKA